MAPRVPVPLREIVYTLSPNQQQIMRQGIEKLPKKILHFFERNGVNFTIMGTVVIGPIWYANWYKEQEKLESRY